jgi:hypothetical protein
VKIGAAEDVQAERAPVLGGEDGEAEQAAAGGRVGPVRAEMRVAHSGSRGQLLLVPPQVREVAEPVDHRVEERDRNSCAFAGLGPLDERCERRDCGVASGPHVAGRDADSRGIVGAPRHGDEPGLSLHDEVVGIPFRVGPVGPVAGDLRVDDVLAYGTHSRLVEAHASGPPRREVLQENVAVPDQPLESGTRRDVLDVKGNTSLPSVHPYEPAGEAGRESVPPAGDVSGARALDLDHVSAEVGQKARAERPGEAVLTRQHAGALEEHPRTVVRF